MKNFLSSLKFMKNRIEPKDKTILMMRKIGLRLTKRGFLFEGSHAASESDASYLYQAQLVDVSGYKPVKLGGLLNVELKKTIATDETAQAFQCTHSVAHIDPDDGHGTGGYLIPEETIYFGDKDTLDEAWEDIFTTIRLTYEKGVSKLVIKKERDNHLPKKEEPLLKDVYTGLRTDRPRTLKEPADDVEEEDGVTPTRPSRRRSSNGRLMSFKQHEFIKDLCGANLWRKRENVTTTMAKKIISELLMIEKQGRKRMSHYMRSYAETLIKKVTGLDVEGL